MTQADTAIERMIRERLLGGLPGSRPGRRGVRHRGGRRLDPLVHRPDRRDAQLHPRRAAVRDAARGRARRRDAGGRAVRARRSTSAGGRWRGGGAWARNRGEAPRRIHVSRRDRARRRPGPVRLAVATSRRRVARRASRPSCATAWRERGFGDFWGYALVAEGAAEAMIEVGLSAWDAAAPLLLLEEAGGRATDFEGRRAIDSGTFLASNGHPARRPSGPDCSRP